MSGEESTSEIDDLMEAIKQQKTGEALGGDYENPQKAMELASQIFNPSPWYEKEFPGISRDFATSNLNVFTIKQLLDKYRSSEFEKAFGLPGRSSMGEVLLLLKAFQSRNGFAVKELGTNRVEVRGGTQEPKRGGWLRRQ